MVYALADDVVLVDDSRTWVNSSGGALEEFLGGPS
jgi:hypothetical protein